MVYTEDNKTINIYTKKDRINVVARGLSVDSLEVLFSMMRGYLVSSVELVMALDLYNERHE